jgi:hypothetical protein
MHMETLPSETSEIPATWRGKRLRHYPKHFAHIAARLSSCLSATDMSRLKAPGLR